MENEANISPRQSKFAENYYNVGSKTFGNCYKSAINAGYSHHTAKSMTVKKPKWLQEKPGNMNLLQPEDLLKRLAEVINDKSVATRDRLRAIELLMKNQGMLLERRQESKLITISLGTNSPPSR